ncbi:asparaginase [Peloplasma aerotolerans]|uniref:asparaginase n=1 Tax=Peloplasma aerotolerans TaxID=3044389 RepID=A0AAW6U919_9MOLU|nr:asparaginase [Mariniplasma sp. M4Ah]MDI6452011.1 asparaginase [Mariniplasma sp. M4Ah]
MKNKTILIIFTGGTISMAKNIETSKTILKDNKDELLQSISSELSDISLLSIQFSLKPSPAITPEDMFTLAKLTKEQLNNPEIDGIVITHGTDTLEETAYFLDLYLDITKPVVFTGSMRNFSELGFDGLSNLLSSILVAASPESTKRGVVVMMNDEINSAAEVTKSHTLALDTFKSMEFGPIGIVEQENVLYYRQTHYPRVLLSPKYIIPEIEIVKVYSGSSSLILNLLIDSHVKGIVLEALGRGNVPPQMIPGITRAIEKGIPVLITSRCPKGRVLDSYGYEGGGHHLKQLGVIFTNNLSSQKARIKLMLALGMTSDLTKLVQYFK